MQGEWQGEAERRKKAAHVCALLREYKSSTALCLAELAELIADALADKAKRYDRATRASLDAVIYVNIRQKHLAPIPVWTCRGAAAVAGLAICIVRLPAA